jgi:hypothetical protein
MPPRAEDVPAPPAPDFAGLTLLLPPAAAAALGAAARQRALSPAALLARIVRDFLRPASWRRPHAQG